MGKKEQTRPELSESQLIDFLYIDKSRVDSLISQIRSGTLRSVTKTIGTSEGSSVSVNGGVPAVVSGGFHETVDVLANRIGLDYVRANRLEVKDGVLTGKVLGEVVTKDVKKASLMQWAAENDLELSQTIAMGDGANDLPMISEAGLGIAFHAKPRVVATAEQSINTIGLDGVLYFLGFKDSYLGEQGKL